MLDDQMPGHNEPEPALLPLRSNAEQSLSGFLSNGPEKIAGWRSLVVVLKEACP